MKLKKTEEKIIEMTYPLITVYPHHAIIGGLLYNSDYNMPNLFNRYINLVYDKFSIRMDFDIALNILYFLKNQDMFFSHALSRTFISKKWKTFKEFLIDSIDDGYCIHGLVNTYYISAYPEFYKQSHFDHNITIYGYNLKEKCFYAADSFDHGKFGFKTVTFDEIEKSFSVVIINDWLHGIHLLKLREEPLTGVIYNINLIKTSIKQFLNSEHSDFITVNEKDRRWTDDFFYGVEVYNKLIELIKDNKEGMYEYDIRLFYVLLDHKRFLSYLTYSLFKVGKIKNANYYYTNFKDLERKMNKICSLITKYNITFKESLLDKIISILEETKKVEMKLFEEMIDDLTDQSENDNRILKGEILCDNINMEYDGDWKERIMNGHLYYKTSQINAFVKYQFYGNEISVNAMTDNTGGTAIVEIDGEKVGEANFYSEETNYDKNVFEIKDLAYGYHTIIIKLSDIVEEENNNINIKKFVVPEVESQELSIIKNQVELINHENKNKGNWTKDYGTKGYDIIGMEQKLPWYISKSGYVFRDTLYVLLFRTKGDIRALHKNDDKEKRIVSFNLSDKEFILDLTISGEKYQWISFYSADFDRFGRAYELEFIDGDTGESLYKEVIEGFEEGVYINYNIRGHVKAKFKKLEGPDIVLSGVFFNN